MIESNLFEEACARGEPGLDPWQSRGRVPLEHPAFRMLRKAYPDLPRPEDITLPQAVA